jgi:hypothetical protein
MTCESRASFCHFGSLLSIIFKTFIPALSWASQDLIQSLIIGPAAPTAAASTTHPASAVASPMEKSKIHGAPVFPVRDVIVMP